MQLAGLHDNGHVAALILQQAKVIQGVAFDNQQVGNRARRDNPDPARVSLTRV